MNNRLALHHLPKWNQNAAYITALGISPLINLLITYLIRDHMSHQHAQAPGQLPDGPDVLGFAAYLLGSILVLLTINLVRTLLYKHQRIRGTLLVLGVLVTADLILNVVLIGYRICTIPTIDATLLLQVSALAYLSLTLTFLFWYWFIDYPTQVRHLHDQDHLCAIVFPREAVLMNAHWLPNLLDYLYLTVMTSNTLGPPENHTPVSRSIKLVQMFHSTTVLVLLVLVVSRAVNTLHQQ
jgi:hypothetical protein